MPADAARLPGDVKAELDEQADALLPEEMRDVLPGGDAVALALDT